MELPPEPRLRWILERAATLARFGAEPVRGLVLPTGEFFPDAFDRSPGSVAALVARVLDHAGLGDLAVELSIVEPDGQAQTVSCSSGACGGTGRVEARLDRVARRSDGSYGLALGAGEIGNAAVLTTAIARSVGYLFLCESGVADETSSKEHEPLSDLTASMLGFGVLVSNGSHVVAKGCSAVTVHSATKMPADELGIALALSCRLFDLPARNATRHLTPTPREAFEEGLAWVDSNAAVVKLLRSDPEVVEAGDYKLAGAKSWFGRLLSGKKKPAVARATEDDLAELERSLAATATTRRDKDPKRERRLDEIRQLWDESLEE